MTPGDRGAFVCLGLGLLLLAGCAGQRPSPPELEGVTARDALRVLEERLASLESIRARGRVTISQAGARFDGRHAFYFRSPDRYRIEVESKPVLGLFDASVVALADHDSLWVYSPSQGYLLESSGKTDLPFLSPALRWVAMEDLRGVLLGLPGVGASASAEGPLKRIGGLLELDLDGAAVQQRVWLEPGNLRVRKCEVRDGDGNLLLVGRYDYGPGEPRVPNRVEVQCPAEDAVILLKHSELDVNPVLDDSLFTLTLPPFVRRYRPGN